ncbi:hypothetical protein [Simplicispira psychrophila]|uniref:hypothetical protein n=1 Tax=Simplicispira psychrophila TaxID=80882 RepID=UPI000488D252|nr:hypothetical protein [Simplicispira psychrophila]
MTARQAPARAHSHAALHRFVQAQTASKLADRLWAWAQNEPELMADLQLWAASEDPLAMRAAITELLKDERQWLERVPVNRYAQRAAQVLAQLSPWLQRDPAVLLDLCAHALHALYDVAVRADDSEGELADISEALLALLLQALRAAPPPGDWLECWWALALADPWEMWDEGVVLAAAGTAVRACYHARAQADWQGWKQVHSTSVPSATDNERSLLRYRYLVSLRSQGDAQAVTAAMTDSLQQPAEFVELVQWCQAQGWHDQALHWAQAGTARYPNDKPCESQLLQCYQQQGDHAAALPLLRRRLQAQPAASTYSAVLDTAERAGHDRAAYRAELFDWIEQREVEEMERQRKSPFRQRDALIGRRVSVQINWHLAEGTIDAALALALAPGTQCDMHTLQALAQQLPPAQDAAAVELLLRVFPTVMAVAASPYTEALELVRTITARMDSVQKTVWLATLRAQYKPKRNFVSGLPS